MEQQLELEVARGLSPLLAEAAAAATPDRRFLAPCWFKAETAEPLHTLIARSSSGTCLAALPVSRRGPLRTVPGSYWPFRSFPVAEELSASRCKALFRSPLARRALGWAFRIGPICEDDPALLLIREAVRGSGYGLIEREVGRCFIHDVDALPRDDPWPHASAIRRNARRERLLAEQGAVRWEFVRGSRWSGAVFDQLAAIENASWIGGEEDAGDCKFKAPGERARWERLSKDSDFAEYMSACLLLVGERPIAFSFDLDVGATRFGIASAYDRTFHQQSPGRLLHYRNTEEAIRRGIRLINWGAGDSGYKRQLGAVPGPRLLDCLLVRDIPGVERLARRFWARRTG